MPPEAYATAAVATIACLGGMRLARSKRFLFSRSCFTCAFLLYVGGVFTAFSADETERVTSAHKECEREVQRDEKLRREIARQDKRAPPPDMEGHWHPVMDASEHPVPAAALGQQQQDVHIELSHRDVRVRGASPLVNCSLGLDDCCYHSGDAMCWQAAAAGSWVRWPACGKRGCLEHTEASSFIVSRCADAKCDASRLASFALVKHASPSRLHPMPLLHVIYHPSGADPRNEGRNLKGDVAVYYVRGKPSGRMPKPPELKAVANALASAREEASRTWRLECAAPPSLAVKWPASLLSAPAALLRRDAQEAAIWLVVFAAPMLVCAVVRRVSCAQDREESYAPVLPSDGLESEAASASGAASTA
jgi:hypothetical protein